MNGHGLLAALVGVTLMGASAAPVASPACPQSLSHVGPPDDVRIKAIHDYRQWHNPMITAYPDGYLVILDWQK